MTEGKRSRKKKSLLEEIKQQTIFLIVTFCIHYTGSSLVLNHLVLDMYFFAFSKVPFEPAFQEFFLNFFKIYLFFK